MTTIWMTHNNRKVFFHCSGGKRSKIQVPVRLVPSAGLRGSICSVLLSQLLEASTRLRRFLTWNSMTPWPPSPSVFLCLLMAFSCVCVCVCVSKLPLGCCIGTTLMTSTYLDHICKDLYHKSDHVPKYQGLGFQHLFGGGGHNASNNRCGFANCWGEFRVSQALPTVWVSSLLKWGEYTRFHP